ENEESYNQSYSLLKVLQILMVEAIVGIIESPFGTGNTTNAALLSARPVFVKNLLQYMFNSVAD
ncbi:hypothetical protein S83_066791, partial [Arachis hypogaea]